MPLTRLQRDQWAEELESGRWKQCRGMLRDAGGGMCCLGVLVDEVLKTPFNSTCDLRDAGVQDTDPFVMLNDRDGLSFPEIAKHVRALPVSEEEV